MIKKAVLIVSLLLLPTYAAFAEKASKYTIAKGGVATEYSYTDWPDLMEKVKTYGGTSDAPVTVSITGNDFDETDKMPHVSNYNTIVCANDNVPYTTFKFENCTFAKADEYDCISFGYAIAKGIVLEFHNCTLNERLYGNEAGTQAGEHYAVDVKFYDCTFKSQSLGGRWFGDVLFEDCRFTNLVSWDNTEPMINAQNGNMNGCRRVNSVGAASKFTVKDCTFDQPITEASWLRFIYAVDFDNYDIDLDYYFFPCLSSQFIISNVADYNNDKLNTGKVQQLKINNNDPSSSKINFLAFVPARVKYEANAPESATLSGETKDDNLYEIGQDFTVKTNGFTCNGYEFKGWNTLANPTEQNPGINYTEGQVEQIPFVGKFTVYAQWEEVQSECAWCNLQELIDNAVNGATVTLSQNVTANLGAHEHKGASCGADAALVIPEGKKITIDLNGYTIDRALAGRTAVENGNIFTVKAGAELTVKDSSEGGTGTLTGGFNTGNGGATAVEAGGTLNLTGGNIVGNISKDRGGAIFNAGELNISGGSFKENRSRNGGSAIEQQGKMSVKGSFSFNADQYVRLCAPSPLTEASRSSYVITKAAAIASGIPVMLENESAGRDILVSGAAQVTAEDATLLSLKLSDMSLSAMFGNTAADAKKDAAIELAALPSVIIRRVGLEEGENAVFKVYYKEKAGDAFPAKALYTVSMNSSNKPKADGAEYAERTVGRVMPGFYKVVEQGWNWTYAKNSASVTPAEQKDSEDTGEGVGKVERNQSLIFTFSGDKSGKPGKHAEGTAVNNFRKYDDLVIEISVTAWKDGGEQVLNY